MLSHVDADNQPAMVDVGDKAVTRRSATARVTVRLPAAVRAAIADGDIRSAKGPVFHTAIVAGTQAAKRTHELIPFCHPLGIDGCRITLAFDAAGDVVIDCTVKVEHRTGVEMEALTGAAVAALTLYDMCKALAHDIVITDLHLVAKHGGRHAYRATGPR